MKFLHYSPLLFLISCGSLSEKDQEEEKQELTRPERQIIGRIASVSKVGEFVLIQILAAQSKKAMPSLVTKIAKKR